MDSGTAFLACTAVGLLLGAVSSVVTRRAGELAGVLFAAGFAAVGVTVLLLGSDHALTPVLAAMLAFAAAAALLDPRPARPSRPTR